MEPPGEPELDLLLHTDPQFDWFRWKYAAIGSAAFHLFAVALLLSYRGSAYVPLPPERMLVRHVTPLYIPPELTQKAPNQQPVKKELVMETIVPRPAVKAPSPAPAAKPAEAPRFSPPPPPQQTARVEPRPVFIDPPKLQAPVQAPPPAQIEPPKIALQEVPQSERGTGAGKTPAPFALPNTSVQEAVRSLSRGAGPSLGQSVGDEGGSGPGLNLPPSAGQPRSTLELKSDPMGVDFRPYMQQVIAAIRRNWFAVYPEAARLGQRGMVVLQFAVAKQGGVTKVVFAGQSNAKALDQSAVAAISASNPLPPLPPEFRGDRIVLQMTFLYNMPR